MLYITDMYIIHHTNTFTHTHIYEHNHLCESLRWRAALSMCARARRCSAARRRRPLTGTTYIDAPFARARVCLSAVRRFSRHHHTHSFAISTPKVRFLTFFWKGKKSKKMVRSRDSIPRALDERWLTLPQKLCMHEVISDQIPRQWTRVGFTVPLFTGGGLGYTAGG